MTDRTKGLLKMAVLLATLLTGVLLIRLTPLGDLVSREGIAQGVEVLRSSPWAPLLFVPAYAAAVGLGIPGTLLTLAGGAVFGLWWGTAFNWLGATIGANLAYALARFLGREGLGQLLGEKSKRWPAMERLDSAVGKHGFRGMLTLRLIPVAPFNALNFGGGLVGMPWPSYALATGLGILPGTFVYTMFADALLQGSTEASRQAFVRVLVSGALLILLSFLPSILTRLRVKLPGAGIALLVAAFLVPAPTEARGQPLPDHSSFTQLLTEFVRPPLVDYARLKEGRWRLDAYLRELAGTDPITLAESPRPVRLAFWINAYNACMLKRVVDHYPIQKKRSFLGGLANALARRPDNSVWQIDDVFQGEHCEIAGSPRSQDHIEHEIIRPMGDPRIHFAVNCAAKSCPPLAPAAYQPATLDEQLDRATKNLVDDPRHFLLVTEGSPKVRLSRVLDWYGEDFGGERGVLTFLSKYLADEEREILLDDAIEVEYFSYDWSLNDLSR
jgi:uncharacterized membrane protein YdjX (TVP38/TMEM64 family)